GGVGGGDGHAVELRPGHDRRLGPGVRGAVGLRPVHAAVVALVDAAGDLGVPGDGVVVDVHPGAAAPGPAAVGGFAQVHAGDEHVLGVGRVDPRLAGPPDRAARGRERTGGEAVAAVGGDVEALLVAELAVAGGGDVDLAGGADPDADAAEGRVGAQADRVAGAQGGDVGQALPGGAAVGGPVQAGAGAAVPA